MMKRNDSSEPDACQARIAELQQQVVLLERQIEDYRAVLQWRWPSVETGSVRPNWSTPAVRPLQEVPFHELAIVPEHCASQEQLIAALHQSEQRFRLAASLASDSIYELDLASGRTRIFNAETSFAERWPALSDIDDAAWQRMLHPDDRERVLQARARLLASDEPFAEEYRFLADEHTVLHLYDQAMVIRDHYGCPIRLLGVTTDLSKRRCAEAVLREKQVHLQAIFDNAAVGIFQITPDGQWLDVNQRGMRMLGYSMAELAQMKYLDVIHPADRARNLHDFQLLDWKRHASFRMERRYLRKDGTLFWGDLSITAIQDAQGKVSSLLGVLVNITRSKEAEAALQRANEQLQQQAIRDALTGLYNRRYLDETLSRELRRAMREQQPLGLVLLDIDYFKRCNDTYGHDAGDALLRAVAGFILNHTRSADLACRYGGEEFVLLLPGASVQDTWQRAEDIRSGIQQLAVPYQGRILDAITVSLGIAVFPHHGVTADLLIKTADRALYWAKRNGRNQIVAAGTCS